MKVFRPSMIGGLIFILAGIPFALIGGGMIVVGYVTGQRDWCGYFFFYLFFGIGTLCSAGGFAMTAFRIETTPDGMHQLSWFGLVCYSDDWTALRSWIVRRTEDKEDPHRFYVELDFAGRPWPTQIDRMFVARPGFQEFLDELRERVGDREEPMDPVVAADLQAFLAR